MSYTVNYLMTPPAHVKVDPAGYAHWRHAAPKMLERSLTSAAAIDLVLWFAGVQTSLDVPSPYEQPGMMLLTAARTFGFTICCTWQAGDRAGQLTTTLSSRELSMSDPAWQSYAAHVGEDMVRKVLAAVAGVYAAFDEERRSDFCRRRDLAARLRLPPEQPT